MKLDTYNHCNMQNSMAMFTFFFFSAGNTLFEQIRSKTKNSKFKLKLDTKTK